MSIPATRRPLAPHATLATATLAALAALLPGTAGAYSWTTCGDRTVVWSGSRATMAINTTSFPVGSTWDGRLQNAMWHWNNVKGAGFNFFVARDTDGTFSHGNGVNEMYFSAADSGTALAVTHSRYTCYWLFGYHAWRNEADVSFNTSYAWTTGPLSYANLGSPYSFESVALHELGHVLGLGHEDRWMATMNSYYPNSGPLGYYKEWDPLADDREGVRFLYRDATTETDVAGSAFKRSGSGTSTRVSSPTVASRGTFVTLEFSFANQGTSTRTFDINFYLSTNSLISTADRYLGGNSGAWAAAGAMGTFSRTLFIPRDIAPGTYYLGFLLDPRGAIAENNESNNGQPMPQAIRIL